VVTRPLRSPSVIAAAGLGLLWCGAAAILSVWLAGRIRDWSVMTDELQYAKLALAAADSYSPLPSIHGASVAATNQLYPLLLAPLYGSLSSPDAFRAAHVANAIVMTSAVVPTYLLARTLLPRAWSFAVALLAVVVPWMVLTGFLLSEAAAYPAFLWAMLAFQRTLVEPTRRRDALAAAALGVAVLARTQFAALAIVLLLSIAMQELVRGEGTLGLRARTALHTHRLLWAVYVVGAVLVATVLILGGGVLGAYSTTVENGSILPAAVWWSAVEHLAVVGIGCGAVPLVLGGGWTLAALGSSNEGRRAFATLSLLTYVVLAIETASFDLRFGGVDVVRDRYLFYVVPLLLIGAAAALREVSRAVLIAGMAVVTAGFATATSTIAYPTFPGLSADTPVSIVNETLIGQSGGLDVGTFVALTVVGLGVALVLALLIVPREPLAITLCAALLGFSLLMLRAEGNRVLESTGLTGRPLAADAGVTLDWVDAVLPEGQTAGLLAFPISTAWDLSAIRWWDVEFWNRSVTRAYTADDGNFTYTTFPLETLRVDRTTGSIAGTSDAPAYLIVAPGDPRLGLAGRAHAENAGFRLVAVERPYRAVWSSHGLTTDGWTVRGRPASIRVYARPASQPEVQRVAITLRAPAASPGAYRVSTETADRAGEISAGSAATETVLVCVSPRSPVDVTVTSSTSTVAAGPPLQPEPGPRRRIGILLGPIEVTPTGRTC
jgi:hypothetical protein